MTNDIPSLHEIARFAEPSFVIDPYPVYARLRREAPVWWCETASAWSITRYKDVKTILCDPESFSSAPTRTNPYLNTAPYGDPNTGMLILTDPPTHRRARRLFTGCGAYTLGRVEKLRDEMRLFCEEIVQGLPKGELEAVGDVALPAVVRLMRHFFHLPEPNSDEPHWKDSLVGYYAPGPDSATTAGLHHYLERVVRMRRAAPLADPVSMAITANDREALLTDAQMAWNLYDLIFAGAASVVAVAADSIGVCAQIPQTQDPAHWRSLHDAWRSTEELLRWGSHIHMVSRTALRDVQLGEQLIRRSDTVFVVLSSANRDELVWDRGEELDLSRGPKQASLTFGFGPHLAVGINLARVFLATLLQMFVNRRRPFELSGAPTHARTRGISTPVSIPIAAGTAL
jgi:cytochrome P450